MSSSLLNRLLAEPAPLPWLVSKPWHHALIVGLVSIGAFVGQLDATIVQLALPTLGQAFNASLQDVSWVALSYLVAFASFLPIFGRLCETVGRKSLYMIGYVLFIIASALCGLAGSFEQLLVFRFLQGIGGALLGANSISILVKTTPPDSRARALGYFAAAQAVGMSAGPALGGVLLATFGWRSIFWVSVPFGAVAAIVGWLALPRSADTDRGKPFDWGGALMIGPALILIVATLNHVSEWGIASPFTLGSLTAAVILLLLLGRRESRFQPPLVDPRLFRSARFCCGAVAVILGYALLYGIFFLMSFAQVHGFGENPGQAGFHLALIPIAIGLTAPFSSDIRKWIGGRHISVVGMLCSLAAILMLAGTLGVVQDHRLFDGIAYVLFGIGLGLFIAPNSNATIAAAPPDLSGAAGSLVSLMRVLGTSLGVATAATILAWRLQVETGAQGDWLSANSESLLAAVRGSLPVLAILAAIAAVTTRIATTGMEPFPSRKAP